MSRADHGATRGIWTARVAVTGTACLATWATAARPVGAHDGPHLGQTALDHAATMAIDVGMFLVIAVPVVTLVARTACSRGLGASTVARALACGGAILFGLGAAGLWQHHLTKAIAPGPAWTLVHLAAAFGLTALVAAAFTARRATPQADAAANASSAASANSAIEVKRKSTSGTASGGRVAP